MASPKQLLPYSYQPKERAAAKAAGEKQYFTGRPCKKGHIANRCTASGSCVVCANASEKKIREKRLLANPNFHKEYYSKRADYFRKKAADYRASNIEKFRDSQNRAKKKRRAQATASERERQANKIGATPKWLTKEHKQQILDTYDMAKRTSELAGFKCHVDHIIPLKGKLVCGLHVPWNLRVTSQSYNCKKNNLVDNETLFISPANGGVMIHNSALPWNWRK